MTHPRTGERGVAAMEVILALPLFLLLLGLIVVLTYGAAVKQRATTAVRHVAWHEARVGPVPNETVRKRIGADAVRVETRNGNDSAPASSASSGAGLASAFGRDGATETELTVTFPSPYPALLRGRTFRMRFDVLRSFWIPEREGIWGALKSFVSLGSKSIGFAEGTP